MAIIGLKHPSVTSHYFSVNWMRQLSSRIGFYTDGANNSTLAFAVDVTLGEADQTPVYVITLSLLPWIASFGNTNTEEALVPGTEEYTTTQGNWLQSGDAWNYRRYGKGDISFETRDVPYNLLVDSKDWIVYIKATPRLDRGKETSGEPGNTNMSAILTVTSILQVRDAVKYDITAGGLAYTFISLH